MADVKWIKITTDMFDNRKIKHLRKLPEGNNIVLIWVMLLTMAGRCNASGMIFLTENIPYTTKMLADEFDFEESTVQWALTMLEQLGMISTDGFLTITSWDEYQNTDKLAELREYNRLAKQKSREKQKLLASVNDKSMTSQECQGTDIEIDKKKKEKKIKNTYGSFENVKLTFEEFDKLREEFGEQETLKTIEFFSSYIAEKGYKSKSHYLAMRRWVFDAARENEARSMKNQQPVF